MRSLRPPPATGPTPRLACGLLLVAFGQPLVVALWRATVARLGHASGAPPAAPARLAWVVLWGVLLGPAAEEYVFRAGGTRALLRRLPEWPAVLVGAALFSAAHADLVQSVPTFGSGLVLGWTYAHTRRVGLCVFCHAAMNGLPFVCAAAGVDPGGAGAVEAVLQPGRRARRVAARVLALALGLALVTRALRAARPLPWREAAAAAAA